MIGTFINIATVIAGGVLGLLLGSKFSSRVRETVVAGLGLFTSALGIQMFLKTENVLIVLGSLLFGALIGELAQIEEKLQSLGKWIEKRYALARNENIDQSGKIPTRFVRGFLSASLLFCVGPMTILGSIQDGLSGDFTLLAIKAVLDGFAALAFASSLGVGVLFSVFIILIYQGGLTLLANQVQMFVTSQMMNEMTAAGGIILLGIGIGSLLEIRPVRAGNFLPALILAPLIVWILSLIGVTI